MYASNPKSAHSAAIHAKAWVRAFAGSHATRTAVAERDTRASSAATIVATMPALRACNPKRAPRSEKTREEDSMAEVSGI